MTGEDAPIEARIRDYLAEQVGAADLQLQDVQRIAVGWSHETWLFAATWTSGGTHHEQGFCLRRDPGNALLREMSDLGVQFDVLQALDGTAVPTPTPYFFEAGTDVLGAPFLVMERVTGVCPSPWGSEGRRFYEQAAARGVLPDSFTDALVAIHSLDWRAAGLERLGVPGPGTDFALREIAKWRALIDASGVEPDPVLTDLICWLEAHAPVTERLTLVHGAYRTGNVLIDDDRVSAVLDWETEVIGDPMYDVAYVLSDLNREGTELLSNLVERDTFRRRYEQGTGIEIDDDACNYYQLLYAMRSAAFWMSATGLYTSGRNDDLRLARTAWSIPVVLDTAARARVLTMTHEEAAATAVFGPDDDRLHTSQLSDRWWETETSWFSFHAPDHRLGGWLYTMVRPNIGTVAGGAWVWDDTAWLPWDVRYSANYSALQMAADTDLRDVELPTGVSMRVVEPTSSYDLGYDDGGRMQLRLRFDGVMPPEPLTAVGSTFGSAHHFDQFGRVTGRVTLDGERIEIDCLAMRDRTWGPRPETRPRQAAYVTGAATAEHAFLAVTNTGSAGEDPVAYGFLRRDGETIGLGGGRRTVWRDEEHGWVERVEITATDAAGRALHAIGEPVSRMVINRHTFIDINSLVRWDLDGEVAWGEDQDMWPVHTFAASRRAARAAAVTGRRPT